MSWQVSYENNRGELIILNEFPYFLKIEDILNYEWTYAQKEYRRGHKIAGFSKDIATSDLSFAIMGHTEAERNANTDAFNNVIEKDIYDGDFGKLWFKDKSLPNDEKGWFAYCYVIASDNTAWDKGVPVIKKKLKIVREREAWYHVTTKESYTEQDSDDEQQELQTGVKDYEAPYDFEYDYLEDKKSVTQIVNPSILGSEFIVTIHGAVNRPQIQIGDTVIHIDLSVPDGAYLTIDSTKKTIILTQADGYQVNAFGARDSAYNAFRRIDSGQNSISWNGAFRWAITLIEERSEPRWLMQ